MKKDDLLKYLMRNQKVFHLDSKDVPYREQLCKSFNCDVKCLFTSYNIILSGDYLVTEDNIGLKPDFLILYPEGHMLFFTLME